MMVQAANLVDLDHSATVDWLNFCGTLREGVRGV